ncbi:MAG: hypothetical protein EBT83_05960 [Betaproteobacteria bacterium]|nr:hypothetical protein [Betaproteobacteria bacterium]
MPSRLSSATTASAYPSSGGNAAVSTPKVRAMQGSGPAIFKQRHYGLIGNEIVVYKFRSMTVMDDGGTVEQARRNDPRMTPITGPCVSISTSFSRRSEWYSNVITRTEFSAPHAEVPKARIKTQHTSVPPGQLSGIECRTYGQMTG